MKMCKKPVSIILAALMMISVLTVMPTVANAEELVFGDFGYDISYNIFTETDYVTITAYNGTDDVVTVPAEIDGIPVEEIVESAFAENEVIKSVNLPEGLKKIDSFAFRDCKSLTEAIIPDSVTVISGCAYMGCENLETIKLSENLEEIGNAVFYGTKWQNEYPEDILCLQGYVLGFKGDKQTVKELEVKEGVKHIADWTFSSMKKLETIKLPSSLEVIGSFVFDSCNSLDNVVIPEGVKKIDSNCFAKCTSLKNISLPESLDELYYSLFDGCTSLEQFTVPDSVTAIYQDLFSNCTSLKTVTIGANVSWYMPAFANCTNLERIEVSKDNENFYSLDGVLVNSKNKSIVAYPNKKGSTYTIPDNIISIGKQSFIDCVDLTEVKFHDGVTLISAEAFLDCPNLKSVTIPASVNYISMAALGFTGEYYLAQKMEDFVIYGYNDTGAERYAKENGFEFISLGDAPATEPSTEPTTEPSTEPTTEPSTLPTTPDEPTEGIMGDVDGDGKVKVTDVTTIQRFAAGIIELIAEQIKTADVNADSKVNVKDATMIQKFLAGIVTGFVTGE
ncbi:MAG: leucine-rich repeat protein [Acutalibacteraceae bacterium]